jgi:two-component system, OmpR family, alkaline phosphatase synthesis response regulator PhoP
MTQKILLVDDEELLCQSLKLNLEDVGDYDVTYTSKPLEAMQKAISFQPDLIILDYIMPEMDGSEVCEALQENPLTQNIPVIFLTAIATHDEANKHGSNIGGQYIVPKPIAIKDLIAAIKLNI